jgi:hypothetical protein
MTMSDEQDGVVDPRSVPEVPEAPPAPETIVISEIDRLRATNVSLRLINAVNKEAIAQHNVKDAQRAALEAAAEREKVAQEATLVRKELSVKYGIDFSTHQINDADGKIIPRQKV